jgi:DNA-binding transcriptional LysR family regulator
MSGRPSTRASLSGSGGPWSAWPIIGPRGPAGGGSADVARERVDLRRLRYFVAVCEHGGFSRASGFVGVAQSALTRQVKLLEKEIGLPLLRRTGSGAEPTRAGKQLLAGARAHLAGLEELVRGLQQRGPTLYGRVTLGRCRTVASLFVDALGAPLQQAHPDLALSLVIEDSSDLRRLLAAGRLDLAGTYREADAAAGFFRPLHRESLVLVTSCGGAICRPVPGTPIKPTELACFDLILPGPSHLLHQIVEAAFRRLDLPLAAKLELDALDRLKALLSGERAGRLASILPPAVVAAPATSGSGFLEQ